MEKGIITRDCWGARPAKWAHRRDFAIKFVFNAITGTKFCTYTEQCVEEMQYLQAYQMNVTSDIRYK